MSRFVESTPASPALQASSLDPYFVLQKSSDSTTQYLQALRLVLGVSSSNTDVCITNLDLDPTKHLRIDADTIEFGAKDTADPNTPFTLQLPGKNVTIVARVIVGNGGTIDVTGVPATSYPPGDAPTQPPPQEGAYGDAGTDGTPGKPGADGGTSGTITIAAESLVGAMTAIADGGAGGRGQDGGIGGTGGVGLHGDDGHKYNDTVENVPSAGGPGGSGGRGGLAGAPGVGGAGGLITIASITANSAFVAQSQSGAAGISAAPGTPGAGGTGGEGGEWLWMVSPGTSWMEIPNTRQAPGSPGDTGLSGAVGDADQAMIAMFLQMANGDPHELDGMEGALTPPGVGCVQLAQAELRAQARGNPPAPVISTLTDYSAFGTTFRLPLTQLQFSLHQAKLSYLDSDFATAGNLLAWIYHVTATPDANATDQWNALHQRAATLLHQLTQGLDYFGDTTNYVPLVSYKTYQDDLDAIFTLAGLIETDYDTYTTELKDQDAQRAAVTHSLSQVSTAVTTLQDQIGTLASDMQAANTLIASLGSDIENKQTAMNDADDAFQKAVSNQADHCSFSDILTAITTLVSVAEDAYKVFSDVKDVTGALTGLSSISGVVDGVTTIIKTAKTVYSDATDAESQFKSIQDGYNSIKDSITKTTPDVSKLVLKEKAFDKAIAPYLDLPEAQAYKEAVHDYVAAVKARNQKIVESDRFATQIAALQAEVSDKNASSAALQAAWSKTSDPTVAPVRAFMAALYQDTRTNLLTLQYQEQQALNYLLLEDTAFSGTDSSIAELANTQETMIKHVIDVQNTIQNVPGTFKDASIVVSASDPSYADAFANFRTTRALTFVVSSDADVFDGYANSRVTSLAVSVHGAATTSGQLMVALTHNGDALFVKQDGTSQAFSHRAVTLNYKYDLSSGAYDSGSEIDDELIGLSPFATWTIYVSNDTNINPGLDLSKVDQITVSFDGETNYLAGATVKSRAAVLPTPAARAVDPAR